MKEQWTIGNWRFKEQEQGEWLPAVVPGCVHTDLIQNGKLTNPFYGTNEKDAQWVDKKDWEYESSFQPSPEQLAGAKQELVFEGLDTYADVYLNGSHILAADNMFRTWRVDVTDIVTAGDNQLRILFRSPIKEDLPKLAQLGYALPAPNDQSEVGGLDDQKISVFARKAPYHYGWDWGPRFVTSGIWRPVYLEGWSYARITDVYIRQDEVRAELAKLTAVIELEADRECDVMLKLASSDNSMFSGHSASLAAGKQTIEIPFEVENPRLWWCRGLGKPELYTFQIECWHSNNEVRYDSHKVTTGLRTIRLVRQQGEVGTSFYMELNGVQVFAKGANHIPNDSFTTRVGYDRYKHEIVSAVQANMNMLRVWGGGFYEEKAFYELCDQYGLLVWQDFMFACSMYPGDEAFLRSVQLEAEDNIKRLRNHPSIALWCGNNEIDTAWSHYIPDGGWGWKKAYTQEQQNKLWADYEAIFHRILPEAVASLSAGIDYWPSSPMVDLTGDRAQHSDASSTSGDIHYWGVWHNVEPFENYNRYVGRFMSEYGFQSFPEYKSVRSYAEEADMELESTVMLAHQKNGAGNRLIKQYMEMYMSEPKDFPAFLYMSQILQAEAMKTAIEAHRRRKPYCMGSLYWQMNDCWPVASWAGMDYYGRWKALQYYAARSFADCLLSVDDRKEEGEISFHIVSDQLVPVQGQLRLRLYSFSGELLGEQSAPVRVRANAAANVLTLQRLELLGAADTAASVLLAELLDETDGRTLASELHYFEPMKDITLAHAELKITESEHNGCTQWALETNTLAKGVWLTCEREGRFSDNFFDLLPGTVKTVTFIPHNLGDFNAVASTGVETKDSRVTARSMVDFIVQANQ
ncbi:beta-mannosidase [Paenibacillus algorifonticola]|uniref:Beta-mannosidase n=1 Tax=Paenibacillus algorifonticola TaxID=684063 RepID=A0A1I1Z174_9BACL|nr:glycoside hydrolase family 2 protein [Paenibacillus algorifonticola]SFE25479.1 beta-mannosidase [Paenibacillus algorifonticola]